MRLAILCHQQTILHSALMLARVECLCFFQLTIPFYPSLNLLTLPCPCKANFYRLDDAHPCNDDTNEYHLLFRPNAQLLSIRDHFQKARQLVFSSSRFKNQSGRCYERTHHYNAPKSRTGVEPATIIQRPLVLTRCDFAQFERHSGFTHPRLSRYLRAGTLNSRLHSRPCLAALGHEQSHHVEARHLLAIPQSTIQNSERTLTLYALPVIGVGCG